MIARPEEKIYSTPHTKIVKQTDIDNINITNYDKNIPDHDKNIPDCIENMNDEHVNTSKSQNDLGTIGQTPLENDEQIHQNLIRENVLQNSNLQFKRNTRGHNNNATRRTFQVGQQVYVDNQQKSSKSDQYAQKLAPPKRSGYIVARKGNDMYEIVSIGNKPMGCWHAKNISLR